MSPPTKNQTDRRIPAKLPLSELIGIFAGNDAPYVQHNLR